MRQMVEVESVTGSMRAASEPAVATTMARFGLFFFVNQRAVRSTLVHAPDAYRNVIPYKRYPVAVLALKCPPAMLT
jgi:DNA mismatch repair ATPase MutL